MTANTKLYDYDDVKVAIDDKYVTYEQDEIEPDLSFKLGELRSELPLILYYEDSEGSSRMEEVCARYGIITAGAACSKIPLPQNALDSTKHKLLEWFDPLRTCNLTTMRELANAGNSLLVGCSTSSRHALALTNELRLANAVLIGPTQAETTKLITSIGLTVPRVSLIEEVSRGTDVPVVATASSSFDVCKALVAGADAALIHVGGPYEPNDDLEFIVKTVVDMLKHNLTELCKASNAKTVRDLAIRCKLLA